MTLCIAWNNHDSLCFASDSRLTNIESGEILSEMATKIFSIKIRIYGPVNSENPSVPEPILHERSYGLCFTGSYLNGSLIANTIEEVLSNLQGTPEYSDFSITNLTEIAFAVFKLISKELATLLRENGLSEILFAGHCLVSDELRLYRFWAENDGQELSFFKEPIVPSKQPIFLGHKLAKEKAGELTDNLKGDYTCFHLLRDIIRDSTVPVVGGNIQAGRFRESSFRTSGIVQYSLIENEHGELSVEDKYEFRGLSLNFNKSELRKGTLNIKKSLFNPFEHERVEMFKNIMENLK